MRTRSSNALDCSIVPTCATRGSAKWYCCQAWTVETVYECVAETWISDRTLSRPFKKVNGFTVEVLEWMNKFTPLKNGCNYLSMLECKLSHITKRTPGDMPNFHNGLIGNIYFYMYLCFHCLHENYFCLVFPDTHYNLSLVSTTHFLWWLQLQTCHRWPVPGVQQGRDDADVWWCLDGLVKSRACNDGTGK